MERLRRSFINWIDKIDLLLISEHFPETKSSGRRVEVELNLSNFAIKTDLKMQQVLIC